MKVVERFIQSKTGDLNTCEDGIFSSEDFIAVVDGATSATTRTFDGKTTAQVAKDILLGALADLQSNIPGREGIMQLDYAIADWYRKNKLYDTMKANPSERCFASAIIFSKYLRQLWMVGECHALIDRRTAYNKYQIYRQTLRRCQSILSRGRATERKNN